jgi:hypothetical protein
MGIDNTIRDTEIEVSDRAKLIVTERLLTALAQKAESNIKVQLQGETAQLKLFHVRCAGVGQDRIIILI